VTIQSSGIFVRNIFKRNQEYGANSKCSEITLWRIAMYLAHFKGHEGREGRNWEAHGCGTGAWVYERALEKAEGRHT
jgi:hypothetical protein